MTFALNLVDLAGIALLGIVGTVLISGEVPQPLDWIGFMSSQSIVMFLLVLASFAFLLKTALGVILARRRQLFLASLEGHFSKLISRHFFTSNLATVKQLSRADYEWAILRSTHIAFGSVMAQALNLFAEASLAILILGFFFYSDWISALLVTGYLSLVILAFQVSTSLKTAETGKNYREGSIDVGKTIADILSSFREISVLSRMDFFLTELDHARTSVAGAHARQYFFQAIPRLIVELALIIGAIGFVLLQFALSGNDPDLGIVSIFLVGSLRMMSAMLPLYRAFQQLRYDGPQARASHELLEQVLRSDESSASSEEEKGLECDPTMVGEASLSVNLNKVSFHYEDQGESGYILSDISLSMAAGTTTALIGPSGAGKSTLVELILGLNLPSSGEISISGHAPQCLRRQFPGIFGYVPQKPGLVRGTLANNIALGVKTADIDHEALGEAIRVAGLEGYVESLSLGVNSGLGEHFDSLSGGQSQRVGLARALYTRPKLIVLDEATSALDAETEASVTSNLAALSYRPTTIVVAHRLSTVRDADTIVVIDRGRIVSSGDFKTLERTSPLFKKYVELLSL